MGQVGAIGLLIVYFRGIHVLIERLGLWMVGFERLIRRVVGCP